MPDITMCSGNGCPIKKDCYRFTAIPCEFRQAYFVTAPVDSEGECEYYAPSEPKYIRTKVVTKDDKS